MRRTERALSTGRRQKSKRRKTSLPSLAAAAASIKKANVGRRCNLVPYAGEVGCWLRASRLPCGARRPRLLTFGGRHFGNRTSAEGESAGDGC